MVLKIKHCLLLLFLFSYIITKAEFTLFYTDKYDSNFFSSSEERNTHLNIGSNLFQFINNKQLNICGAFIDSFLRTENIEFNKAISFNNRNTLEFELLNINATKCKEISEIWFEKYNISWIKLLKDIIVIEDIKEDNPDLMILKKLYLDERSRLFHVSNIINNTLLAFVIPSNLSNNDFTKSQTVLNTKRYTSLEPEISYTEVLYNDLNNNNDIDLILPSANKHSFLKNCISLYILKNLNKNEKISEINYHIAQTIIKYNFKADSNNFENFSLNFIERNISKEQFKELRTLAINDVLRSIGKDNLFFYSYYDILKLKQMHHLYEQDNLTRQIELLNKKNKFVVEVSELNPYFVKSIKLESIHKTDFDKAYFFKSNSIEFKNETDTLIYQKLNLFLTLNTNYNLIIKSFSKKSEYLFIEKSKKDAIISQYNKVKHSISYSKKLKLYRSLVIFAKLTNLGIDAQRIKNVGLKGKKPIVMFEFTKQD